MNTKTKIDRIQDILLQVRDVYLNTDYLSNAALMRSICVKNQK